MYDFRRCSMKTANLLPNSVGEGQTTTLCKIVSRLTWRDRQTTSTSRTIFSWRDPAAHSYIRPPLLWPLRSPSFSFTSHFMNLNVKCGQTDIEKVACFPCRADPH